MPAKDMDFHSLGLSTQQIYIYIYIYIYAKATICHSQTQEHETILSLFHHSIFIFLTNNSSRICLYYYYSFNIGLCKDDKRPHLHPLPSFPSRYQPLFSANLNSDKAPPALRLTNALYPPELALSDAPSPLLHARNASGSPSLRAAWPSSPLAPPTSLPPCSIAASLARPHAKRSVGAHQARPRCETS